MNRSCCIVAVTFVAGWAGCAAGVEDAGEDVENGPSMGAGVNSIPGRPNIHVRGGFVNSRIRFERERKGRVAFMGGSITEMNGYRPMVCAMLRERFPEAEFDFVNAGISSTCSTTGAFRMGRDVLARGRVDLLLVEFAVNDHQDAGHGETECVRGMEGIVRQARRLNPAIDIVNIHFVNPPMVQDYDAGRTPAVIAAHERVASHYAVSSINFAKDVAERIRAGEFDWKKFGGTHPSRFGNALCAELVRELLDATWKGSPGGGPEGEDEGAEVRPHDMPAEPLDPLCYERGRFIGPDHARDLEGFRAGVPEWKAIRGNLRGRFAGVPFLHADEPGASFRLGFEGTAVGIYVLAGPDAGTVEFALDGARAKEVDLYHRFSRGLHYPRTCMLQAELAPGRHELVLRVSKAKNPASRGHAVRILAVAAN